MKKQNKQKNKEDKLTWKDFSCLLIWYCCCCCCCCCCCICCCWLKLDCSGSVWVVYGCIGTEVWWGNVFVWYCCWVLNVWYCIFWDSVNEKKSKLFTSRDHFVHISFNFIICACKISRPSWHIWSDIYLLGFCQQKKIHFFPRSVSSYFFLLQNYLDFQRTIKNLLQTPFSYSKTCVKRPLSKRVKIGFQDQLLLNAGENFCNDRQ